MFALNSVASKTLLRLAKSTASVFSAVPSAYIFKKTNPTMPAGFDMHLCYHYKEGKKFAVVRDELPDYVTSQCGKYKYPIFCHPIIPCGVKLGRVISGNDIREMRDVGFSTLNYFVAHVPGIYSWGIGFDENGKYKFTISGEYKSLEYIPDIISGIVVSKIEQCDGNFYFK